MSQDRYLPFHSILSTAHSWSKRVLLPWPWGYWRSLRSPITMGFLTRVRHGSHSPPSLRVTSPFRAFLALALNIPSAFSANNTILMEPLRSRISLLLQTRDRPFLRILPLLHWDRDRLLRSLFPSLSLPRSRGEEFECLSVTKIPLNGRN